MADYGSYATPRADLGEALIEYRREGEGGFVTSKILPPLTVPKKSATFSAFTRASILAVSDVKRAPRGKYNRIEGKGADHSYNCQNYGVEQAVDDSEREFFSNDFDADLMAMMMVEGRIKRAQERRAAALLFSETVFAADMTDHSADAPWTDESTDIVGQADDAKEASRAQTGLKPNTMLFSRKTLNRIKRNQDIKSRRNITMVLSDQEIEDSLKEIFGVEQLLIADEVFNAASENAPADVQDIWDDKHVLFAYCAREGASLSEPSLGRLMQWFIPGMRVTSYREEKISSDVVRVEHWADEFLYDTAYGHLIKIKP